MDFIDEARIYVRAGHGGKGCISFRREKYVPKGGPDGGEGGHGGHVIFVANPQLSTLQDFKYRQHYEAEDGTQGGGAQKTGRSGDDLIVQVPVGTILRHEESRELLIDLCKSGQEYVAARGGRGGKGNMFFATSRNQTPRIAQDGEPGDELVVRLELKLLADVALVGFPNAGKSTLISTVSAARPKIADYPFTTLVPNLGVAEIGRGTDRKTFVVADIPGLIEGAHEGRGLGIRFLRHIERCSLLWFILELGNESLAPTDAYTVLLQELEAFNPSLLDRPRAIVLSKQDLCSDDTEIENLKASFETKGLPCFVISAATRTGLDPLLWHTAGILETARQERIRLEELEDEGPLPT